MEAGFWDKRYGAPEEEFVYGTEPNLHVRQAAERYFAPPSRIVELACGEGRNVAHLAAQQTHHADRGRVSRTGVFARIALGSPPFLAPEYAELWVAPGGSRTAARLQLATSPKQDIWAVGALVYDVLIGHPPFSGPTIEGQPEMPLQQLADAICSQPHSPPLHAAVPGLSAAAADFVALALQKDPAARPSAKELLAHPWLAAQGAAHIQRRTFLEQQPAPARQAPSRCAPPSSRYKAPAPPPAHETPHSAGAPTRDEQPPSKPCSEPVTCAVGAEGGSCGRGAATGPGAAKATGPGAAKAGAARREKRRRQQRSSSGHR
ncbi:putative serine/threonine-protein kinase [Tetrabaena socialis]|uniref:Putative serine/threonine-protein kinase n=1 Tax=Tetrabaena socialis TaxID=47790 RepID=A0A2J8A1R0_9CHLO|nr:putative serine/threonine-protein kinase [Tetrabaena socialis]|eukprot:PNH06440.1 putative serine/threonine-protein kinase [Tetrabaena socialis]